jgi:hypothetical protein
MTYDDGCAIVRESFAGLDKGDEEYLYGYVGCYSSECYQVLLRREVVEFVSLTIRFETADIGNRERLLLVDMLNDDSRLSASSGRVLGVSRHCQLRNHGEVAGSCDQWVWKRYGEQSRRGAFKGRGRGRK